MKTQYLITKDLDTTGLVSVSQIMIHMSCKKKWEYSYIENLTPRVDRAFLTIGKLCHKGMQEAMQAMWENPDMHWHDARDVGENAITAEWQKYMNSNCFLDEEIPDMKQVLVDTISVFHQAFEEFKPWKYEVLTLQKGKRKIPALELHFKIPCAGSKGLHGFIDAILKDKETGFIWCTDYKFRKSLSDDTEEAYNVQNATYTRACNLIGIPITGTMTWQHCNTPASDPAILKNGTVSRARIKTTWSHYREFCLNNDIDPTEYEEEMTEKLSGIEWCRPTFEYRNDETVNRIWEEVVTPAAKSIKRSHTKNAVNHRSMYPWNCKMCQFGDLCQAELRGYDANSIRANSFNVRKRVDKNMIDNTMTDMI